MKFIPAILTDDINEAFLQIVRSAEVFNSIQIDIADNTFVPNTTISIQDIISYLNDNTNVQKTLKHVNFDIHLMVNDYISAIHACKKLSDYVSISVVFVHIQLRPDTKQIHAMKYPFRIGFVFNPDDDVKMYSELYNFNAKIYRDIQIMTVYPGFQGAQFEPSALTKIAQLREIGFDGTIYIDGSVNDKTVPIIIKQPFTPDVAGVGSFLSKATDIRQAKAILERSSTN